MFWETKVSYFTHSLRVATTVVLATLSLSQVQAFTLSESNVGVGFETLGGLVDDNAIFDSAGRETQVYKVINAIVGMDFSVPEHHFTGNFEFVLIGDEVSRDDENQARVDYYKNIGADLLYYGDYPVRNAHVTFQKESSNWSYKFGRMVNLHGMNFDELPYRHRHDAPHAVFLDKELLNGLQVDYRFQSLTLSGAILNGRGRPDSDYNYYLEGQTDPNIKGNNTPVFEFKMNYQPFDSFNIYASIHRNKTGSAPGEYGNGKYNDNRVAAGFYQSFRSYRRWFNSVEFWGQYNSYLIGLTESGVQGTAASKDNAKNLTKKGYFTTIRLGILPRWSLQYTREELDRVDSRVWTEIAKEDINSSALEAKETSDIWSIEYKVNESTMISLFHRKLDNPFPNLSGITSNTAVDNPYKAGLLVNVRY